MDQSGELVKTVTAMQARQNFGQMLEEVYYKSELFIIERAGRPMAAVVPLSLLKELQRSNGRAKASPDTSAKRKRRPRQAKD